MTTSPTEMHVQAVPRTALTVAEAARSLGLGESIVRELIAGKRLGVVRVGRRVLVPLAAIDDFLRQHSEGPGG